MLRQLTERVFSGDMSASTYTKEYEAVLEFAGWTDDDLVEALDVRWTKQTKPAMLFQC